MSPKATPAGMKMATLVVPDHSCPVAALVPSPPSRPRPLHLYHLRAGARPRRGPLQVPCRRERRVDDWKSPHDGCTGRDNCRDRLLRYIVRATVKAISERIGYRVYAGRLRPPTPLRTRHKRRPKAIAAPERADVAGSGTEDILKVNVPLPTLVVLPASPTRTPLPVKLPVFGDEKKLGANVIIMPPPLGPDVLKPPQVRLTFVAVPKSKHESTLSLAVNP
jgi:hypothetical protein